MTVQGGPFSSFPALRRCGVAICRLDANENRWWSFACNLPGDVQTVPRGELYGLFIVVSRARPKSILEYVTDNQKVKDVYNKGLILAALSINCDFLLLFLDT